MFGIHRCLAGERSENCCREPRVGFEEAEKLRKRDGRDDAIGQRSDRIEGILEEATGKADKVSRKGDIKNLATPVMQYPVANGDALDQHEQRVVLATFGNYLPIAPDEACYRL